MVIDQLKKSLTNRLMLNTLRPKQFIRFMPKYDF
jgi:hypothetical protein